MLGIFLALWIGHLVKILRTKVKIPLLKPNAQWKPDITAQPLPNSPARWWNVSFLVNNMSRA